MSNAEADRIMTSPGKMHELEEAVINGNKLRVYKHLPRVCGLFLISLGLHHLSVAFSRVAPSTLDNDCCLFDREVNVARPTRARDVEQ